MKTFILNSINRLKSYSQNLDAESTLYSKSWEVFNETGDKELFIFRPNNDLLISRNGIVQKGKWELLNIATLLIDIGERSYLLNAAYIEDQFLALNLDGTNEFMVMIETDMKDRFSLNTIGSIENYLEDRYKRIEQERIDKEQAEQKILEDGRIREEQIEKEKERKELFRLFEEERKKEKKQIEQEKKEGENRTEKLYYLKYKMKKYKQYTIGSLIFFILSILTLIFIAVLLFTPVSDNYSFLIFLAIIFIIITMVLLKKMKSYSDVYDEYEKLKSKQNQS
ncbi:DUF2207 domain-containing protein [Proteiniphilum acetatigenes]|uniref:DUF2207 domain-containing protein n=1 Tax=Proteiniphilum acetatigenes TaxID=294710 RepID=UPI0003672E1D|nr:DUF2207 domain-containing protein [Proteiniphilum acetatigenes]